MSVKTYTKNKFRKEQGLTEEVTYE